MHSKYSRNKNCNLDKSQIAVFQYTILFSAYFPKAKKVIARPIQVNSNQKDSYSSRSYNQNR